MAQLIHLRQRIKAIETIKKITHAMRLISMSTHAQLKKRSPFVTAYTNAINDLFKKLRASEKEKKEKHRIQPKKDHLIILIGAQKGLCGNFNVYLFHFLFEHTEHQTVDLIVIGKKALEYAEHQRRPILKSITNLSLRALNSLATELTEIILQELTTYARISIISNSAKTFFQQTPRLQTLVPLPENNGHNHQLEDYHWEQNKQELSEILLRTYIQAEVYHALFQSLMAEQAARFISMDSSTRNAKELLETTKLHYNKLRQANITKELTELSSSFTQM